MDSNGYKAELKNIVSIGLLNRYYLSQNFLFFHIHLQKNL